MKRERGNGSGRRKHVPRIRRRTLVEGVTRAEWDSLLGIFNERSEFMDGLRRDIDIQFKRIAQIQADLDLIKRAWQKRKPR